MNRIRLWMRPPVWYNHISPNKQNVFLFTKSRLPDKVFTQTMTTALTRLFLMLFGVTASQTSNSCKYSIAAHHLIRLPGLALLGMCAEGANHPSLNVSWKYIYLNQIIQRYFVGKKGHTYDDRLWLKMDVGQPQKLPELVLPGDQDDRNTRSESAKISNDLDQPRKLSMMITKTVPHQSSCSISQTTAFALINIIHFLQTRR